MIKCYRAYFSSVLSFLLRYVTLITHLFALQYMTQWAALIVMLFLHTAL